MTSTSRFLPLLSLLALALGACADDPAVPTDAALSDPPPEAVTAAAPETIVDADYLAGEWCFVEAVIGDEREPETLAYVFSADGTLVAQDAPTADVDQAGTWAVDGRRLAIEPMFAFLPDSLAVVEPDRFVLESPMARLIFERGACS